MNSSKETMEKVKHKKCPFCGANPYMTHAMGEYWVSCDQCEAGTAMSAFEDVAWQHWDQRADEDKRFPLMVVGDDHDRIPLIEAINQIGFDGIIIAGDDPQVSLGLETRRFELPERYTHTKMPKESNAERCGYSTKRK